MTRILPNRLLWTIVLMIAAYWTIFPVVPRPNGANAISILSICAGIFLFIQYAEAAFLILIKRDRRDGWVAVLSATIAALGVILSGAYVLLWNYFGQPETWISSAASAFGRALFTAGFFGMGFSHQIMRIGGNYPKGFWRAVVIAFGLVLAFLSGAYFGSPSA